MEVYETMSRWLSGDDLEGFDEYAERILEAAEAQFEAHGLQRTSLNRIAAEAGVSRATLFNRFANRDALLAAVIARQTRRLIAEIDAEVAGKSTPEERLIAGIVAAGRGLAEHRWLRTLLVTDRDDVLPVMTTGFEPILAIARAYVAQQITRARDQGMPVAGDPEILAEVFVRLAHSLALSPASVIPLADPDRMAALTRAHFLPLLQGPGTPTQEA